MNDTDAERRSPREALEGLAGFEDAEPLGRISDGPTSRSWLLERMGERYVLRLDKVEAESLGLDRHNEKLVCEAVAAAGLGPAVTHFEPRAGICLRRWEPGRACSPYELRDRRLLERLATTVRRVHGLSRIGGRFEPDAAVERYAAQIDTQAARAVAREAKAVLADLSLEDPDRRLCHNDLVCGNIIVPDEAAQGSLRLIDWEYAALGDPYFDLAVISEHHELERDRAAHLLDAYHDGRTRPEQRERHRLQCVFYRHLLSLWEQRMAIAIPASDSA